MRLNMILTLVHALLQSLPPPSTSLQPLSHDAFETGALESARVELVRLVSLVEEEGG